eukprot:5268322-Amphidinium_carterae.1
MNTCSSNTECLDKERALCSVKSGSSRLHSTCMHKLSYVLLSLTTARQTVQGVTLVVLVFWTLAKLPFLSFYMALQFLPRVPQLQVSGASAHRHTVPHTEKKESSNDCLAGGASCLLLGRKPAEAMICEHKQ